MAWNKASRVLFVSASESLGVTTILWVFRSVKETSTLTAIGFKLVLAMILSRRLKGVLMSTSDALTDYYNYIVQQPLLSLEEEKELVNTIFCKDCSQAEKKKAKDRLLTANLRFVFHSARRRAVKADSFMFEELVSLGNEGLIKGLEKYDPSVGVRFLSYAGWWVMQHQLKGQANMRLVSLPLWKQQLAALIGKEVTRLGRPLTEEELEDKFPGHKARDLVDLQHCRYLSVSIEDYEGDPFTTSDLEEDLLEMIEKEELIEKVNSLPELDRELITLYYGLGNCDKMHITDIAKKMSMSPERIRRCIPKVIKKLQDKFLGASRHLSGLPSD